MPLDVSVGEPAKTREGRFSGLDPHRLPRWCILPRMGVGRLLVATILVALQASVLCAQDGPVGVVGGEPVCPWPPPSAHQLEYRVVFSQTQSSGTVLTPVPPHAEEGRTLQVSDRQEIQGEAQYRKVFGKPSEGVDWMTQRIFVIQVTTTYRLGELYSRVSIAGIHADDEGIYIGTDVAHYGPVQGIAQLAEWFSHDRTDLFLLLPALPERIVVYTCPVGAPQTDVP